MSRCFPYPPPGFIGKSASNDALIQSIKLQKEKEKIDRERKKEKKREKKEKKRTSKENNETSKLALTGIDHKTHKVERSLTETKGGNAKKRKQEDAEQLERSVITEEHGQPILQNPSCSSDSTQNSNKRRKQAPPVHANVTDSQVHGNIFMIRLQKDKESDVSASKEQLPSTSGRKEQESNVSASKQQLCSNSERKGHQKVSNGLASKEQLPSTSGRINITPGHSGHHVVGRTGQTISSTSLGANNVVQELSSSPAKGLSFSTSERTGVLAQDYKRTASGSRSGSTSREKKMRKMDSLYNNLIQNLGQLALPMGEAPGIDDEEWLFQIKHSDKAVEKKVNASKDVSCSRSAILWRPLAPYLPEVGIYALPYTAPF